MKKHIIWGLFSSMLLLVSVQFLSSGCTQVSTTTTSTTTTTTATTSTSLGTSTTTTTEGTTTTTAAGATTTTASGSTTSTTAGSTSHVVLAEVFTATWCYWCPYADRGIERLATEEGSDKIIVLEYHVNDAYAADGVSAVTSKYGVAGYPSVMFDGIVSKVGANPDSGDGTDYDQLCYDAYSAVLSARTTLDATVSISATLSVANRVASVSATVTNLGDNPLSDLVIHSVIYEDLEEAEYLFVVRDIMYTQEVTTLSAGASQLYSSNSATLTSEADVNNIAAVIFVQDSNTNQVLDSKEVAP